MKVIFDISPVNHNPKKNTGLARVAWSTAQALQELLGEKVSFSACGSILATFEAETLLTTHPEFCSAIASLSDSERHLVKLQQELLSIKTNSKGFQKISYSAIFQLIINVQRIQNILRSPIEPNQLKAADIFHSSYARIPKQVRNESDKHCILTVHDLTPLILDQKYFPSSQLGITRRIINSIQPQDWVVTVSESTRNDLLNYRLDLNPERVQVIPNAASSYLFYHVEEKETINYILEKYKIPKECYYFLSLHSMASQKNMPHLIRSFVNLIEQEKITDLVLVLSGGQNRSINYLMQELDIPNKYHEYIYFTGYVEDEDLATLYSGAIGFVFPSLYEGFGLPVLEAMQCGCPVIASNTSSLPEVVADAGMLVNPNDQNELSYAMLALYSNDSLSDKLREKGIWRANSYSWKKTATQLNQLYCKVLAG